MLLDSLSVVQNLAVPFTLDIDPLREEIRDRVVALAREVGLPEAVWSRPLTEIDEADRMRIRLARALALDPAIVLLEHPTATLAPHHVVPLGRQIRAVGQRRGTATLALTADASFAAAVATHVLALEPATGRLKEKRRFGWFRRRLG